MSASPNYPHSSKWVNSSIHSSHLCGNFIRAPLTIVMRELNHEEVQLEASFHLNSSSTTEPIQILAKLEYSCFLQDWTKALSSGSAIKPCRRLIPAMPLVFGAIVHTYELWVVPKHLWGTYLGIRIALYLSDQRQCFHYIFKPVFAVERLHIINGSLHISFLNKKPREKKQPETLFPSTKEKNPNILALWRDCYVGFETYRKWQFTNLWRTKTTYVVFSLKDERLYGWEMTTLWCLKVSMQGFHSLFLQFNWI